MVSRSPAPIYHFVIFDRRHIGKPKQHQMTENKLRKLINKPRDPPKGERRHKPVILADSKGKRLEEHIYHDIDKEIDWNSKGGAQVEGSTNWLRRNIARKIIRYGDIWLYVWLGTCNLTTKNQKNNFISLTSETDDEIDNIPYIG